MPKNRKVIWTHSDKRGTRRYKTIMALSKALGRNYSVTYRYLEKGYTGDSDIKAHGRPLGAGSASRRQKMLQAFMRHGLVWRKV